MWMIIAATQPLKVQKMGVLSVENSMDRTFLATKVEKIPQYMELFFREMPKNLREKMENVRQKSEKLRENLKNIARNLNRPGKSG